MNGETLARVVDKYQGRSICDLKSDELNEYFAAIAHRGAADALKALGLADETAGNDIRDLRDILRGFRVVRKSLFATTMAAIGRVIAWVIVITLAGYFVGHNQEAKNIAKMVAE